MTARFYGNGRVGAGRRDARRRSAPGWRGCIERAAAILVDTQPRFSGMNFCVRVLFSPPRFPCHPSMYTCSYSLSTLSSPLLYLLSRRLLLLDPLSVLSPHTLPSYSHRHPPQQGRNNAALFEKLGPVTGGLAFRTEKEKIRRGMVPGDDGSITLTPIFNIVSLFAEFDDERISPIIGRRSRVSFDLSALLF